MVIKAYSSLSEKAINEVLNLEKACKEFDKLKGSVFLDTSLNFDHNIKSVFLLYENRELISMLSMFIPTQQEAEISAFTLPEYRQSGCFKALLSKAIDELKKFEIQNILFVCESQSISGKEVAAALNAEYDHTEYSMSFNSTKFECQDKYRLSLITPNLKDLEKIIEISMKTFDDGYEDSKSLIENCLQTKPRKQYLAVLNDEIIGLGSINKQRDEALIFGFGIVPEYRGVGYGKELLHLIIDRLRQSGTTEIMLDVNSDNVYALKLYKKCGFQIEVVFDYYKKRLVM